MTDIRRFLWISVAVNCLIFFTCGVQSYSEVNEVLEAAGIQAEEVAKLAGKSSHKSHGSKSSKKGLQAGKSY